MDSLQWIDPRLAAARGPLGERRFYPSGLHPAVRQWRLHLRDLHDLRDRLLAAELDASDTEAAIEYVVETIERFERREEIAKADYLRTVER